MLERLVDLGRVEAGIDLVEHEQAGFHGEALGELQTLAPRERQRRRRPVGDVSEAGEFQVLARVACASRDAARAARQTARRRRRSPAPSSSGTAARSGTCARGPSRAIWCGRWRVMSLAVEAHAAAVGRMHAGDHIDERGLAGAVRADQADDLARLDRKARRPRRR